MPRMACKFLVGSGRAVPLEVGVVELDGEVWADEEVVLVVMAAR